VPISSHEVFRGLEAAVDLPICHYPAIIEGDAETGYSVFFPDVPGCTS
jgi:hypothetical protein